MLDIDVLIKELLKPGDIILTSNPSKIIGRLIKFGQEIEEGDKAKYTHGAIALQRRELDYLDFNADGRIAECVHRISVNNLSDYIGHDIAVIRHKQMDPSAYENGIMEVKDNINQIYPYHRLIFHGLDMINSWAKRVIFRSKTPLKFRYMRLMPLDWPVCTEMVAQFILACGLEGGWRNGEKWRGVNPDHCHDVVGTRADLWDMIAEGGLRDRRKIK